MSSEGQTPIRSERLLDWQSDRKEILRAANFVTAAVIVTALYFASEVLIPITLAALLTFILAPLVNLLRQIRIPRAAAVVVTVVLALGIITGIGAVIGTQIADLARELPNYQTTLEKKLLHLRQSTVAPLSRALSRFQPTAEQQAQGTASQSNNAARSTPDQKPVPVEVQQPPLSPVQVGTKVLQPVMHPAATLVIMLVVTIFALLYREDIRDRVIRVFGRGDLTRTTSAMDDAAHRLSRYFLAQLAINSTFGVVIAIGTYLIGVPHPILWGVVGAVLRFVPYLGAWIAAALPTLLAVTVDPGWSMALMTVALYAVTEFFAGQILEPLLYGHSTGLSPIAVIIAAIFWTWLWGPVGLIISTPVTLCAVVLGKHIEQLSFIDVLLGSRAALRPSESLYQRLLAGDADEAEDQLTDFAKEHGLVDYYDNVAVEALQLATADFKSRKLSPPAAGELRSTFEELIEFARAMGDQKSKDGSDGLGMAPRIAADAEIVCFSGRGPFDSLAALMLSHLFGLHGIEVNTSFEEFISRENPNSVESNNNRLVFLLYLDARGLLTNARLLIRRLKERNPKTTVLLGLVPEAAIDGNEKLSRVGADDYVSSLKEALEIGLRLIDEPVGSGGARHQVTNVEVSHMQEATPQALAPNLR
jgi:predicted PurR-regulated permease PerM